MRRKHKRKNAEEMRDAKLDDAKDFLDNAMDVARSLPLKHREQFARELREYLELHTAYIGER